MPVVKARLRAVSEHCSLSLNVRHRLGDAEQESHQVLRSLPSEVRVYAAQKIVLSLSGTVNNVQVPVQEVASSQLAINLRDYLQMAIALYSSPTSLTFYLQNADELVLDDVGQPYRDESSVLSQNVAPIPMLFALIRPVMPHLRLHRIDLICSWEIKHSSDEDNLHDDYQPFAKITALSFITMFNDMLSRAVKWQLVRRYPIIFGCWCKQLGVETRFLRSIISSALSIQARSSSSHKPLKEITRHGMAIVRVACSTLDDLGCTASTPPVQRTSSSEALMILMERVFHLGLHRKQFKGTSRIARDSSDNKEMMEPPEWSPDGPSLFLDPPDGSSDECEDTVDHVLDPGSDDFRDDMHICTYGEDDEHTVPPGPFQDVSFEPDLEDLSDKEIPSSTPPFDLDPPAGDWEDAVDDVLNPFSDDEDLSIASPTHPQLGQPFQDEDLPFDFASDLEDEDPALLSSSRGHIRSQVVLQDNNNKASLPILRHSSQDSICDLEDDILTPPDLGPIDANFWHTLDDQEMEDCMADYHCGKEGICLSTFEYASMGPDQGDRELSPSLRPDREIKEDFFMEDGDDYILGFDGTLSLHDYEG